MQDFLFYLQLGWEHIISKEALDHQLFILALVTVFRLQDFKKVLLLVTAFTIGHSLTLILSVMDVIRIPSNWVEFLIPCTIAFTAADNLFFGAREHKTINLNYFLALIFGLVHGMGFANSVRLMIASEQQIALPLFGFNGGLELGQIVVVGAALLLHFLVLIFLKIPNKYWVFGLSSGILLLALQMILQRLPF